MAFKYSVVTFLGLAVIIGPTYGSPIISPSVVQIHRIACMQEYNACVKRNSAFGSTAWLHVEECQQAVIGCIIASDTTASQIYGISGSSGSVSPSLYVPNDSEEKVEDERNEDTSGSHGTDEKAPSVVEVVVLETSTEVTVLEQTISATTSEQDQEQPQQSVDVDDITLPLDEPSTPQEQPQPEVVIVDQHDSGSSNQQVLNTKPDEYEYHSNNRLRTGINRHQRLDHSKQAAEVRRLTKVLEEIRAGVD